MEVKSREDVIAERKMRKAAKQSKKLTSASKQGDNLCPEKDAKTEEISKKIKNLKVSEASSRSPSSSEVSTVTTNKSDSPVTCGTSEQNTCQKNANKDKKKLEVMPKTSGKTCGPSEESSVAEVTKTKAQLKAERRALQEAQRAMKSQKKASDDKVKTESAHQLKVKATPVSKTNKENQIIKTNDPNKVKLVSHLYLETNPRDLDVLKKCRFGIHASVLQLGQQYKHKVIIGSNARVVAFLNTLKQVLIDFSCEHNFPREFEVVLECVIQYLKTCRPPSVSMTNAAKFLKWHLTQLPRNIPSPEAQIKLRELIEDYLYKIDKAGEAISDSVRQKISQDDVILTFGYSSLIKRILKEGFEMGIKFRVVIVDAGPLYEGKQLLRKLAKKGLPCTYVLLSAASYIMNEATKVLLGAHALLTNGYVMSRAGASQIALIARSYNVPVLVCCETHKFSERVQTDALVHNELGDPLPMSKTNQCKSNYMKSLTLMYDVTPSDLVTAVVTELAILPCTSVPAVLRVKPTNPSMI